MPKYPWAVRAGGPLLGGGVVQPQLSALAFIDESKHEAILNRSSTDDVTVELQAWMDAVKTQKKKGVWPAGVYNISAPLFQTKNAFETSQIEGDGRGHEDGLSQTLLRASHLDGPAIIIQNARGVKLSNISIIGQNLAPVGNTPTDDPADYLSPGVRAERYSPHCGICLDATVGNVPPDGGYPALTAEYQGRIGGSYDVLIDAVNIQQFAVGVVFSPDGESSQGDGVWITRCRIRNCETAMSWGQSQSRANVVRDTDISFCRVGFVNNVHGAQQGAIGKLCGLQFVSLYRLFDGTDQFDTLSMTDCYAASFKQIGKWGAGGSSTKYPIHIAGSQFSLTNDQDPITLSCFAPGNLTGCTIKHAPSTARAINIVGTTGLRFDSCTVIGGWTNNAAASVGNHLSGGAAYAQFLNTAIMSPFDSTPIIRQNLNAGTLVGDQPQSISFGVVNVDIQATTITFDAGTSAAFIANGDLIFWKVPDFVVPALFVTNVAGVTITCDKLYDASFYDETNWYSDVLNKFESGTVDAINAHIPKVETVTPYKLELSDSDKRTVIYMNLAGANAVTIPDNKEVPLPNRGEWRIMQFGAGVTTIACENGNVNLNGIAGGSATITSQWGEVHIRKLADNLYVMSGDHTVVV